MILVMFLSAYSAWKLNNISIPATASALAIERSFIWINSDSLESCITKTYPSTFGVKVSNKKKKFEIEYPSNKRILFHNVSEGAKTDLDSLKLNANDFFEYEEEHNKIRISLIVEDGFVYCPTALLLPLLDDNKDN